MPKLLDLVGQRFGRLTVLSFVERNEGYRYFWKCRCDCGTEVVAASADFKRGAKQSCGCLQSETRLVNRRSHGMCGTLTHKSWQAMLRRVKAAEKSKWYASRGIGVCYRWRSFENFYADMGERPAGTSLDRIDNDRGYEPGNCRWATKVQQAGNKQTSVVLELNGKRQCVTAWSREIGVKRQTLDKRLDAGWPVERVLTPRLLHECKGRRKHGV